MNRSFSCNNIVSRLIASYNDSDVSAFSIRRNITPTPPILLIPVNIPEDANERHPPSINALDDVLYDATEFNITIPLDNLFSFIIILSIPVQLFAPFPLPAMPPGTPGRLPSLSELLESW